MPGATAIKISRPVKVIFENIQDKGSVCEVYWERKNKKERLSFGISNDFTKHEKEKYKKLKEELKIREAKGEKV